MSDITMEQRLQLVQQVRSRYHENQSDLSSRERILYGKTSADPGKTGYFSAYEDPYGNRFDGNDIPGDSPFTFFRLRFILAMVLLAFVILMDKNSIDVAGVNSEKIFEMISADYESKIEEWVEAMSASTAK